MRNHFTVQGNAHTFTEAVKKLNDIYCLLYVMTGVDHSKAQNDATAISVSIELAADLLWDVCEDLGTLIVKGGNHA